MKKRILLIGLLLVFVSSAANARPEFYSFQNVYSDHREFSADFGGGSLWMMIATTFATENTCPVYLKDFPTNGSDLQLQYLPGWSVPNTTFGHCYSEVFSHTGMGETYDPPDNPSCVRDYYYYIDVDSSGNFSLGDVLSSVRTISEGDIQQLGIPQTNFLDQMLTFEQQGLLRIRTTLYLLYNDNCGVVLGEWYKLHPPSRDPSLILRINGIKIMSDGGSCNRPAFSLDLPEWAVRNGPQGDLYLSAKELTEIVSEAQAGGYQVAVHAMGDRAIETVLNGIEGALNGRPIHIDIA